MYLIAFLETGRSNFVIPFLRNLTSHNFVWFCLPPHGRYGGILVGVNVDSLKCQKRRRDFSVKMHLRSVIFYDGIWSCPRL
jgi:hypothetical protein